LHLAAKSWIVTGTLKNLAADQQYVLLGSGHMFAARMV